MATINVFAAGILGGAYGGFRRGKGVDLDKQVMLLHAVSDASVNVGRFKRDAGEAFCNRKINDATTLVDSGGWESDVRKVSCPKCIEILARITK